MNINCVICSDLFSPSASIYVTKCGHIFHHDCLITWLDRSTTCPQCRDKTTTRTIHRIYFNLSTEGDGNDLGTLQNKVDELSSEIRSKERDVKLTNEKYTRAKGQNTGLRAEIQELEQREKLNASAIHALKDQIVYFKTKANQTSKLTADLERMRSQLHNFENVQIAINGSREELNDMLKNEPDIESVALLASTLKKSLIEAEERKRQYEYKYKRAQQALEANRKLITTLQGANEQMMTALTKTEKQWKSDLEIWAQEKSYFRSKLAEQLENKVGDASNTSIYRAISESPLPLAVLARKEKKNDKGDGCSNSNEAGPSAPNDLLIVESSSPSPGQYWPKLNRALDSKVALKPSTSQLSSQQSQYSIFKNQLNVQVQSRKVVPTNPDLHYDGLGGTAREDIYPSPRPAPTGLKRSKASKMTSSKFRRLAPPPPRPSRND